MGPLAPARVKGGNEFKVGKVVGPFRGPVGRRRKREPGIRSVQRARVPPGVRGCCRPMKSWRGLNVPGDKAKKRGWRRAGTKNTARWAGWAGNQRAGRSGAVEGWKRGRRAIGTGKERENRQQGDRRAVAGAKNHAQYKKRPTVGAESMSESQKGRFGRKPEGAHKTARKCEPGTKAAGGPEKQGGGEQLSAAKGYKGPGRESKAGRNRWMAVGARQKRSGSLPEKSAREDGAGMGCRQRPAKVGRATNSSASGRMRRAKKRAEDCLGVGKRGCREECARVARANRTSTQHGTRSPVAGQGGGDGCNRWMSHERSGGQIEERPEGRPPAGAGEANRSNSQRGTQSAPVVKGQNAPEISPGVQGWRGSVEARRKGRGGGPGPTGAKKQSGRGRRLGPG